MRYQGSEIFNSTERILNRLVRTLSHSPCLISVLFPLAPQIIFSFVHSSSPCSRIPVLGPFILVADWSYWGMNFRVDMLGMYTITMNWFLTCWSCCSRRRWHTTPLQSFPFQIEKDKTPFFSRDNDVSFYWSLHARFSYNFTYVTVIKYSDKKQYTYKNVYLIYSSRLQSIVCKIYSVKGLRQLVTLHPQWKVEKI